MNDEAEFLARKAAYIDTLRAIGKPQRQMGLAGVMVGAAVLVWAKVDGDPLSPVGLAGITVLAAGWALFVYAFIKRNGYVRTHPFNPNA